MACAGNDGDQASIGCEHARELALIERRKQVRDHIERAIAHGNRLHVGDEIRGIAALCRKAHHLLAKVEAIRLDPIDHTHGTRVVPLATADVEQADGSRSFANPRGNHIYQLVFERRIVALVEKVASAPRLLLGITHRIARTVGAQQIEVAFSRAVEAMTLGAYGSMFIEGKLPRANGAAQHCYRHRALLIGQDETRNVPGRIRA